MKIVNFILLLLLLSAKINAQITPLLLSLEYRYAGEKYGYKSGGASQGNSTSKQFIVGISTTLPNEFRIGVKGGFTLDKVYSSFSLIQNDFDNNSQLYFGVNAEKKLISILQNRIFLYAAIEFSVEPFISRSTLFNRYSTIGSDKVLLYEGIYYNKKTRLGVIPFFKAGIGLTQKVSANISFGYAVNLNKSNQWVYYRGNERDFNGTFNEVADFRENYLFFGVGATVQIFDKQE